MVLLLENQFEINKLKSSLIRYFDTELHFEITSLLKKSKVKSIEVHYDNWNGGTYYYAIILELEVEEFSKVRPYIDDYSEIIKEAADLFLHLPVNESLSEIKISPILKYYIDWSLTSGMTSREEILDKIESIKNIMISVATGETLINDVQADYQELYSTLDYVFSLLALENPNTFENLWDWYTRWNSSELNTYASRRTFILNLYKDLLKVITSSPENPPEVDYVLSGWERVDRTIYEMQKILSYASTEEQFQSIGLLGREALITVAQEVYIQEIHTSEEKIDVSKTDSKRMLNDYIAHELPGPSNEDSRRYAKAAVSLANSLTHDRKASKRDAKLCLLSVTSVVSIIKSLNETAVPF